MTRKIRLINWLSLAVFLPAVVGATVCRGISAGTDVAEIFGMPKQNATLTAAASQLPPQIHVNLAVRDSYLAGIPVLVRIEVIRDDGRVERELWNAVAALSVDNPSVILSKNQITLCNGLGSTLAVFTGSGDFKLTAKVNGMEDTRLLTDLAGELVTSVSGTLAGDPVWSGIIHVTGDVVVPASRTLTIQPGTLVLIDGVSSGSGGADIDVLGTIKSLGTAASPVTFTASDPAKAWGEIHHEHAAASAYQYTDITLAGHSPGGGHTGTGPALRSVGSKIVFDHVCLTDNAGKVMQASSGSDLTFRNCHLARSVMGPEIQGTALVFENTWITEMLAPDDSDGIYIHDQLAGQTCLMKGGVVANVNDDCVDTLGCKLTIEDQILRDAKDKGVSIYGGEVNINHCLVVGNNKAPEDPTVSTVAAKTFESSTTVVNIDHTTIVTSKVPGHSDIGIQSHNKYGVKSGTVIYNVTNSIIDATDPVNVQAPYLASDVHINYSDVFDETWTGAGNIHADPIFADPNNGDYHVNSQAGRWEPGKQAWIMDNVTSPCIDAGDPMSPIGLEPFPNGGRVNMGAYGGTAEASKSYFGEPPCETIIAGDINGDCKVDFSDFSIMTLHWLQAVE